MTADAIRHYITAVPFRPFTLHTADGRAIPVHARDFALVSPLGLTVHVFQPDDSQDLLDTSLITNVSSAAAVSPQSLSNQPASP